MQTSLTGPYSWTEFKRLQKPKYRDFGLGDPNYKAEKVKLSIRNAYLTNISRLLAALDDKDKDGNEQLCQYFPGVGTVKVPDAEDLGILLRLMHLTVGIEVTRRISETYTWLCSVCNADASVQKKIFVGWSRGAFTAHAVAGMVSRYCILRAKDGKCKTDEFMGLVDKFRATYFKRSGQGWG